MSLLYYIADFLSTCRPLVDESNNKTSSVNGEPKFNGVSQLAFSIDAIRSGNIGNKNKVIQSKFLSLFQRVLFFRKNLSLKSSFIGTPSILLPSKLPSLNS